jgi:hypothetical protein
MPTVALIDTTGKLDAEMVTSVAAALNVQVTRDLPQYWTVQATVTSLAHTKKVPAGVWPVHLVPSLPPGEGGVHMDMHNQPYAKVIATPADDSWTIDASHETLEMLVDPYGNRLQSSAAIQIESNGTITDSTGEFNYLVEACDPCEANNYAYSVQGVALSDFLTPHFYDPVTTAGTRYSFAGNIKAPRQILPGGYISYVNMETNEWQQILWVDPSQKPTINNLGPATQGTSLRVWVDSMMVKYKAKNKIKRVVNASLLARCKQHRAKLSQIATARAKLYK